MKEFVFSYERDGYYLDNMTSSASFGGECEVRLVIKPHDYSISVSDEVLRKSECAGYIIDITNRGGAKFYDTDNSLLAEHPETESVFPEFSVVWKENKLSVCFGHTETVDHYPNCDGEHDRYSEKWITDYKISK